ncbi:MAG TPA: hypothetical protein VGR62_03860 [Candidatus Binatia bacterium]|nr:hypothetical protein [Candidatus Binatia bacterium]
MTTPKRPRKAATTTKKPRRAPTKARPRTRKTKTAAAVADDPLEVVAAAPEPEPEAPLLAIEEALVDEAPLEEAPAENAVIITSNPEPGFVARVPPPEPPRVRPSVRRGIFFDVENTSRSADISRVLEHLDIDWVGHATEFMAVGNWRVIGHDTARLLARKGAALVHSAPSVGVRDWSDLRIAVAAGVWLAGARPGDVVEIVSDDQAFDAVGDVAASLGVLFRRTSYRALAGMRHEAVVEREVTPAPASDNRARGRGGRGRSRRSGGRDERRPSRPAVAVAPAPRPAPPPPDDSEPMQTAPHDEIVGVVRDLLEKTPGGVSLDALANSLRERGFSRPPGSPRLITRLRRIKQLDIGRQGMIRIVDPDAAPLPHENRAPAPVRDVQPMDEDEIGDLAHPLELNAHGVAEPDPEPIEVDAELVATDTGDFDDEGEGEGDGGPDDGSPEGTTAEGAAGEGGARRRRRRGGRRRRGRRGGASAVATAPVEGV